MAKFIEPPSAGSAVSRADRIASTLEIEGLDPSVFSSLVNAAISDDEKANGQDAELEGLIETIGLHLRPLQELTNAAKVVAFMQAYAGRTICPNRHELGLLLLFPATEVLDRISPHAVAQMSPTECRDALLELWESNLADCSAVSLRRTGVLAALVKEVPLDIASFLDPEAMRDSPKQVRSYDTRQVENDIRLPDFWLQVNPDATVEACGKLLQEESRDGLATLAWAIERALSIHYGGVEDAQIHESLSQVSIQLCRRRVVDELQDDRLLTECCWAFVRYAFELKPDAFPTELRDPLVALALQELGQLRSSLRAVDAAEHLDQAKVQYLGSAIFFLLRLDYVPLWSVLKRLLLAFREMPKRAIPLDLRTWHEGQREKIPMPWHHIPKWFSLALNNFLGTEEARDPQLEKLRGEFATYCLARLKTKERTTDGVMEFTEPNPMWRAGYAHALRELRANPGGRGHRALQWSLRNDPDEVVRAAAELAYQVVRKSHGVPLEQSPRRPLYAAFWCLRQAHVLSMGEIPDECGAQRTFNKEVRRSESASDQ